MAQDVPNASLSGSNFFQRAAFAVVGLVACVWRGQLWKYNSLLKQAAWESAEFSAPTFTRDKCPWGMAAGPRTPHRSGSIMAEGGTVERAVYGSWWGAWLDRLDWDHRAGAVVNREQSIEQYTRACMMAGWFGTSGGLPILRPDYPANVASTLGGEDGFGIVQAVLGGLWQVLLVLLVLGCIITAVVVLVRYLSRKVKLKRHARR